MNWYRNLDLGIKINLVVILAISVITAGLLTLEYMSSTKLVTEIGRARIEDEIVLIEKNLISFQQQMINASVLLSYTPGVDKAISTNDVNLLQTLYLRVLPNLTIDNIKIFNSQGFNILETETDLGIDSEQESELIDQALLGIQRTTLLNSNEDTNNLTLVTITPVRTSDSQIVGGIMLTRKINDEFMKSLNSGRQKIVLAAICSVAKCYETMKAKR